VTDYVLRGVSQTSGAAALQGGLGYRSQRGLFAGVWASSIDPYPALGRALELDLYGGAGWTLGEDWTARASYSRYLYVRDRRPDAYGYGELALTMTFQDLVAATVSYQPDSARYSTWGYVHHRATAAYEVSARWPLPGNVALTGSAGYYDLERLLGASYWSGSAGMIYARDRLEVSVTRFMSDGTARRLFDGAAPKGRWVAAAVWRF